MISMFISMVK